MVIFTMPSGRICFRGGLRWLERALWFAGSCALGYCAYSAIDAALTQASLTRSFEQARIRINRRTQPALNLPSELVDKAPAQLGTKQMVRLEIPGIGLSALVLEGVESRTLRAGLGHVPGTPRPGWAGNIVIAGHRDTFFRPLRKIQICDEILVETPDRTYRYQVDSFEVVDPHEVSALRFHGKDELTLISCYPFFYIGPAPKRFVVHAEPVLKPGKCRLSGSPVQAIP